MNVNLQPIIKEGWNFVKKHSTKFLAGGALGAEILGFWFMHKEAPVVRQKLDELPPEATTLDKIKTAVPIYLPAATMLLISGGCIVGGAVAAASIETKLVAMTNLAMANQATLKKYEEKMINEIGPEKAKEMHDQVAQEICEEAVPTDQKHITATTHGTDIFFDPLCNTLFTSSEHYIRKAAAKLNDRINGGTELYVEVNDWRYELGLKPAILGKGWCWRIGNSISIEFSTPKQLDDGRWYRDIIYFNPPTLPDGSNANAISKW